MNDIDLSFDVNAIEDLGDDIVFDVFTDKDSQIIIKLDELGLPELGYTKFVAVNRKLNAAAFVEKICRDEIIEEAYFFMFSVNLRGAKKIIELIESGRIKKATVLISNLRNNSAKASDRLVKEMFRECEGVRLAYANSGMRGAVMRTDKGNYYSFFGSGNFGYNSRRELYRIDNSEEVIELMREIINEIESDSDFEEIT